eukprot:NODE_2728_length_1354_cov_42.588952_g2591_i0.p1 GENE.NODE_2728_length_1354_cov_42.588952_g2591_i0~~NODE_2728_length_1354_cov_42.588952_g2591_i0.p1  ORF type:complete len:295 (-),score=81.97 NODE_2728_length_1354_cov_42.588952_g2591_i0:212-1096(-)
MAKEVACAEYMKQVDNMSSSKKNHTATAGIYEWIQSQGKSFMPTFNYRPVADGIVATAKIPGKTRSAVGKDNNAAKEKVSQLLLDKLRAESASKEAKEDNAKSGDKRPSSAGQEVVPPKKKSKKSDSTPAAQTETEAQTQSPTPIAKAVSEDKEEAPVKKSSKKKKAAKKSPAAAAVTTEPLEIQTKKKNKKSKKEAGTEQQDLAGAEVLANATKATTKKLKKKRKAVADDGTGLPEQEGASSTLKKVKKIKNWSQAAADCLEVTDESTPVAEAVTTIKKKAKKSKKKSNQSAV